MELPVAIHLDAGEMNETTTRHLGSIHDAPAFISGEPLRCRLASAKMRSDHLLCMGPRMVRGVSFDDRLDRDDLVVRLPQCHPLVISGARR
jgi:hypothetical protein